MSGPLPGVLLPLTAPLSWVYGRIIAARNRRYDRGRGVERVDVPVISVGNLTAGGSGKTPLVMWITSMLREAGRQPVIAMRGYGATSDTPSDEADEYGQRLPDVPLLVNPDRVAAVRAHEGPMDCVVLDDGFQHRRLARDLDLVIIDGSRETLGDRLLPAGFLREPPSSLRRADAVVVTRVDAVDERLAAAIERHHGRPPLAWSRHAWTALRVLDAEADQITGLDWLSGRRVVTMLGVGHPASIRAQLKAHGASIMADVPARDHEAYDRSKVLVARGLCDGAEAFVVTAKDWVKLRRLIDFDDWPVPIVVPHLEIDIVHGADALRDRILQTLSPSTA